MLTRSSWNVVCPMRLLPKPSTPKQRMRGTICPIMACPLYLTRRTMCCRKGNEKGSRIAASAPGVKQR